MEANYNPIKISFVIPVYNAQKYLQDCLDSVMCQLEGNELILVNDGSTDSSGEICDTYAASGKAVSVLHIENHGVAYARNLGVSHAVGEYIVFLDADDYINKDFCACFKKQTFDADLIFYPVRKQYGEKTFVPMGDGLQQDRLAKQPVEAVLDFIARCPKFPASPWGKIIRRDFLNRNQISFPLYVGHEDYDWTYMLLQHCQSFDFFESGMYTYRQIIGSRSSMQNSKNIQAHIELMERWVQMAVSADFRVHLNAYLAYQYSMALPFWGSLPAKQRKEYRVKMKRFRHLLDFGKTKKIKLVRYAVSLLGTENAAYLLYRYICMRNKRLELQ